MKHMLSSQELVNIDVTPMSQFAFRGLTEPYRGCSQNYTLEF